jgi:polysaccharide export outer membrane protein
MLNLRRQKYRIVGALDRRIIPPRQEPGQGAGGLNIITRQKINQCAAFVLILSGLSNPLRPETNPSPTANGQAPAKPRPQAQTAKKVSPDYVVGEGDVLLINVWKEPEVSEKAVVRPDGKISLPLVGEVTVSGLTPIEIEVLLVGALKAILKNPQVTVTVEDIRSKTVYLTGDVAKPGSYPLLTPMTIMQLIATAGGLRFSKGKHIYILRTENGRQTRYRFNYQDYLRGRNGAQDIALRSGDSVVVQ